MAAGLFGEILDELLYIVAIVVQDLPMGNLAFSQAVGFCSVNQPREVLLRQLTSTN